MGMTKNGLSYWQAEAIGEPLLNLTIGDLLDRRATELPEREATVYSGYPEFGGALDFRWSYAQYRERAEQVALGLMAAGLQKGEQLTVEELRDFCKGQISSQKIPRYFQFVAAYPMTASGKVQKFVLRENAIQALGLDQAAQIKTA